MKQEVQVTITVFIDTNRSKDSIKEAFIQYSPFDIEKIEIKEEAEIYNNK